MRGSAQRLLKRIEGGVFFPLLGFAVRIRHWFWLLAVVLGLRARTGVELLEWTAVVTVSVLLHELGHAFLAARWGVVYRIELHGMGGTTTWRPTGAHTWWNDVAVSLAGPAVGLTAGFLLNQMPLDQAPRLLQLAVHDLAWTGIVWSAFNLLPILPLDGGQAVRAALARFYGETGEYASSIIAVIAAAAAATAAVAKDQAWAAIIVGYYGYRSFLVARQHYWNRRATRWQRPS